MKLKNEPDEFIAFLRERIVAQIRDRFRFDRNRTGIGWIEQTENIKQRALAAAGRPDDRMDAARLEIERDAAQRVHALLFFPEIAVDVAATKRNLPVHTLDPRNVTTGGSSAARRAGT